MDANEARAHAEAYFNQNLPQYTVLEIRRKSCHPDDSHLWMVSAQKSDGTYAFWSGWNDHTRNLNYGHYGLNSIEECEKLFAEFYYKG